MMAALPVVVNAVSGEVMESQSPGC
jgi:hypothetical protein